MAANAEACWLMLASCSASLLNVARVVYACVPIEAVVCRMYSAHTTLLQAAAVLQIVSVRDLAIDALCEQVQAGMSSLCVGHGASSSSSSAAATAAPASHMISSGASTSSKTSKLGSDRSLQDTAVSAPPLAAWEERRCTLAAEEVIGVVLELASIMHEGWARVLPLLQRLHFHLSKHARVHAPEPSANASVARARVVREGSNRISADQVKQSRSVPSSPASLPAQPSPEVAPMDALVSADKVAAAGTVGCLAAAALLERRCPEAP